MRLNLNMNKNEILLKEEVNFNVNGKEFEGVCIVDMSVPAKLMKLQKNQEEFQKMEKKEKEKNSLRIVSEALSFINEVFEIKKIDGEEVDYKIEDINLSNALMESLGTQIFPSISKVERAKTEV